MAASRTWAGKKMILDHLEMSEGMEMLRWKKKISTLMGVWQRDIGASWKNQMDNAGII